MCATLVYVPTYGTAASAWPEIGRVSTLHACKCTLFENKNEWQKTEQVKTTLSRASRNLLDVKTRNETKVTHMD